MQNRLHKQTSQQKKLVNNGKLPKFTNNIVDLDLYRAKHYFKEIDLNAWKPFQSFFAVHNFSPIDAFVLLCVLEFQRRDKPSYHCAIAEYIGCCQKTVQRSLNKLNRRGVISYITGRYDGRIKLPSRITVLIDLPSKHALKSFACKKKAYRERINNRNLFVLARRVSNSRKKHAQNQNVHLYNIKNYKESIASKTLINLRGKMEKNDPPKVHFDPNHELVMSIARNLQLNPLLVRKSLEKGIKKYWLNELDTEPNWQKRASKWVENEIKPKEFDLYNKEKSAQIKQLKQKTSNDNWQEVQKQQMEQILEKQDITLDKEGLLRAVALETKNPKYVNETKDRHQIVIFDEASKTITLANPPAYQKKSISPELITILKKYYPEYTNYRDDL